MAVQMQNLPALFPCLLRNQSGGTAIEYSLIASAIAVAILATVVSIGDHIVGLFQAVAVATAFH